MVMVHEACAFPHRPYSVVVHAAFLVAPLIIIIALQSGWFFTGLSIFFDVQIIFHLFCCADYLPLIIVGMLFRMVAYAGILGMSTDFRQNRKFNKKNLPVEIAFFTVAVLPRATIQGALGNVPTQEGFFDEEAQKVFAESAAFTIALMAPVGAVMLEYFGPKVTRPSFSLPCTRSYLLFFGKFLLTPAAEVL
jgi:hypothetical protein